MTGWVYMYMGESTHLQGSEAAVYVVAKPPAQWAVVEGLVQMVLAHLALRWQILRSYLAAMPWLAWLVELRLCSNP